MLFRLYGLYERDVKRVSASALDDLPALFHAFVARHACCSGSTCKLLHGHGLARRRGARLRRLGVAARVPRCGRRPARRAAGSAGPSRVLLVGHSAITDALVRKMRAHPEYGLEPVGAVSVDERGEAAGAPASRPARARSTCASWSLGRQVERVIVTAQDLADEAMMDLVHDCGAASVKVSLLPTTSTPSARRWRSTTSRG